MYDNLNGTLSLNVFKSSGTTFSKSTWRTSTLVASRAKIAAGDVNGDRKADVVMLYDLGNSTSRLYSFISTGTGFKTPVTMYESAAGAMAFSKSKLTATDVNGDGKAEAVVQYDLGLGNSAMYVFKAAAGTLKGSVRTAVGNAALGGVTVKAFSGATLVGSATTAADGSYTLSVPAATTLTLTFSKTGYLGVSYYNVSVGVGQTRYLETVYMVGSTYSAGGTISGTAINAFTGTGIGGVTISLRQGIGNRTGTVVKSGASAANGTYSLTSVPGGVYTAQFSRAGFTTTYVTVIAVGGQTRGNQNGTLTPTLATGQMRMVLTWGLVPHDLDSHFTGPIPGSASRFHIYYSSKIFRSGVTTIAQLDVDDVTSYGPETVTLSQRITGTYRYSIYDFHNSGGGTELSASGAKVQVYSSAGLVATYDVPTGRTGGLWTVFEIRNGVIVPINTITTFTGGSYNVP
jgi:hypothetical protein